MSGHACKELTDGCYRCDLNRDEIAAIDTENEADAQAAWVEYRDYVMSQHIFAGPTITSRSIDRVQRRLRKREFIAGFIAGRQS